jgi:2'-phosphotransferase
MKPKGFASDESLSKGLAYVLRHGAGREGFKLHEGGYLVVEDILNHQRFRNLCEEDDIRRIVMKDAKGRFSLRNNPLTGKLQIRANQGHTICVVDDGTLMTSIDDDPPPKMVVHGTTLTNWYTIKFQGLSRMRRNHIHFCDGMPGDNPSVVSGFRSSSSVAIIIDVRKAMIDGIEFFRSRNNVILSSGNSDGVIRPKYFKKVINLKTNEEIIWK